MNIHAQRMAVFRIQITIEKWLVNKIKFYSLDIGDNIHRLMQYSA